MIESNNKYFLKSLRQKYYYCVEVWERIYMSLLPQQVFHFIMRPEGLLSKLSHNTLKARSNNSFNQSVLCNVNPEHKLSERCLEISIHSYFRQCIVYLKIFNVSPVGWDNSVSLKWWQICYVGKGSEKEDPVHPVDVAVKGVSTFCWVTTYGSSQVEVDIYILIAK